MSFIETSGENEGIKVLNHHRGHSIFIDTQFEDEILFVCMCVICVLIMIK